MAEFEVTFDVEDTKEDYKLFIEKLRAMLRDESLGNLPVLPPQENELPTRFFDIVFHTSNRSIRMRFRRDNIFLVGYQMSNQWYEFGIASQNPPHLIDSSTFLGFTGTYEEQYLEGLLLGQQQLINAVNQLSTTIDSDIRKRSIMTLIQMICEAIRFKDISNHLGDAFNKPEFEVTFDVEDSKEDYKLFIEKLRAMLREESLSPRLGNLPVLPPQENERPTRSFDIIFHTSNRSVRMRFRRDNIYLVGYQMSNNQWYEFGIASQNPPHLIDNSIFLGFSGTYEEQYLRGLLLGQQQLINAVNQLSTTTDSDIRKRSIMTLIQMICEAIRFKDISNHLVDTFYTAGLPPTDQMINLEHIYGDLSRALVNADPNPDDFQISTNRLNIQYAYQAIPLLGIVLQVCMNRGNLTGDGVCTGGRPLVEVYSVRILNIDNEDPGDLYGTITVSDGLSTQYIFNRSRDDIQSIRPRELAILTGPERAISALGNFTIDLALKDRDRDLSPDDDISKKKISWEITNPSNLYDDPIYENAPGQYGSAEVNYIVFSDAVQAKVEVTLKNGDDENPADVYGTISCWNGNFTNQSVLFQRSSDEHVSVSPGNLIPLWRSVVAVPLNSSLTVHADVWDYDIISANDEIAVGSVDFPANLFGSFEKPVYGKYGEIRVKVTWT